MTPKPLLRKITQIGLVVRDVDETARRCWEQFGLGPWTFITYDPSTVTEMKVHGRPVDYAMRTGHAQIGDLDWEIIQPLDDRSIYAEHLRTRGEGLHHILFDVDDYDAAKERIEGLGYPEIGSGRWAGNPYSYFDTESVFGAIVELWAPPADRSTLPPPESTYP